MMYCSTLIHLLPALSALLYIFDSFTGTYCYFIHTFLRVNILLLPWAIDNSDNDS